MMLSSPRPGSPLSSELHSVGYVGQVTLITLPKADPEIDL